MSEHDPFGRKGEDEEPGIPGGWLPPAGGGRQEPEVEHKPHFEPPVPEPGPEAPQQRPVFERPGGGAAPAPGPVTPGGRAAASGKATASLVLGIVGLLFCPLVCSVAALLLGRRARAEIDASGGALRGRGNATAGIVLGWVGVGMSLLLLILIVAGGIEIDEGGAAIPPVAPLAVL